MADTTSEADDRPPHSSETSSTAAGPLLQQSTIAGPLREPDQLIALGLMKRKTDPMPIVVELNLRYEAGLEAAKDRMLELYREVVKDPEARAQRVADIYMRCRLNLTQVYDLVRRDTYEDDRTTPRMPGQRAVYRVWPDFPVETLIYRSVATVKADAARRSFAASGQGIVWGVVDSGIDAEHPHFAMHKTVSSEEVAKLHRDFTDPNEPIESALKDGYGHGTHVAGIIAGALRARPASMGDETAEPPKDPGFRIFEEVKADDLDDNSAVRVEDHTKLVTDPGMLSGIAPECRLVSLKVLDDEGRGSSMNVVRALEYVRREVNGSSSKLPRIHGVNLSVGYEFLADWFACGQSPLCDEVNRLVRSGVVVVVAAGNTGYGTLAARARRDTKTGLTLTINDPGNAELAITVGATHRDMPHTYGVSYFSSKGPTGDGRPKPDLVAPGERITSCAAGRRLIRVQPSAPDIKACYVDETGTSMAAPHVSGAIAAFLSIRREYIGQPESIKRIFLESATSLGRERYFQGFGLVDLMRAIQSV